MSRAVCAVSELVAKVAPSAESAEITICGRAISAFLRGADFTVVAKFAPYLTRSRQ